MSRLANIDEQIANNLSIVLTIPMDELDRAIVTALRSDARTPVSALAKSLNVARATVQHRITRLENSGAIAAYTITSRPDSGANLVRAIMSIVVEGNNQQSLVRDLKVRPSVTAVYSTNGRWDLIAEIQAASLEDFDCELNEIRQLKWISKSETNILLSTFK